MDEIVINYYFLVLYISTYSILKYSSWQIRISSFTHMLIDRFKTTLLAPQTEWMVSEEAPMGIVSSHFVQEHENWENG